MVPAPQWNAASYHECFSVRSEKRKENISNRPKESTTDVHSNPHSGKENTAPVSQSHFEETIVPGLDGEEQESMMRFRPTSQADVVRQLINP